MAKMAGIYTLYHRLVGGEDKGEAVATNTHISTIYAPVMYTRLCIMF
jgi:hypothetical protein